MPMESSSVQEYLDQMHEFTTIAAIQVRLLCWSKNAWLASGTRNGIAFKYFADKVCIQGQADIVAWCIAR